MQHFVPLTSYNLQILVGLLAYHEQLHTFSPVDSQSQKVSKHDFEHYQSLEQHADASVSLARYDFILVFYSDFISTWNHFEIQAIKVHP